MPHTFQCFAADSMGVDRSNRTIRGLVIMQLGPTKTKEPWLVDMTTLRQLVELGNAGKIQAHLTHDHTGQEGIGDRLGEFSNFRIDMDVVRADLKLFEAASKSPSGDIADFVMTLAEETDDFGVSVVVGTAKGDMVGDRVQMRIKEFLSADVVGRPAATAAAFETQPEEEDEMNEELNALITTQGEQIAALTATVEKLTAEPDKPNPDDDQTQVLRLQAYKEQFGNPGIEWGLQGKDERECFKLFIKKQADELQAKDAEIAKLQAKIATYTELAGEDLQASFNEYSEAEKAEQQEQANPWQRTVPGLAGAPARN